LISPEKTARLNAFLDPCWVPIVDKNTRILITGATGGLGRALVAMLQKGSDVVVGAHGGSKDFDTSGAKNIIGFVRRLRTEQDCISTVDAFVEKVDGIDALVCLNGRLTKTDHWDTLSGKEWEDDIQDNLNTPFFLARAALRYMKRQETGGNIILNGTESALHGGSAQSFAYAIAKRGTEALVQGLAREGAPYGIRVNGVRMGYIKSGFHERWAGKDIAALEARAKMIPMKRGGEPEEAAALFTYLLSGWSKFISGQMFSITGGDWL